MTASLAAGRNTAVNPDATPIRRPPTRVPGRLPMPPTMMAIKLGINRPVPMVGSKPSCPAASTPLRPARKIPTATFSERSNRLEVDAAVTDTNAEPGVAQQQEQQRDRDHHHGDHEQAIAGDEKQIVAQGLRQKGRNRDRLALRAPDEAGAILDHEGEAEGQQQAVQRIASVKRADQHALDGKTDDGGQGRRQQQRAPEADIGRDLIGDVAADDEKSAMGEIDDVAQIENEREAERHQHIEGADDQPVGDIEQEKLRHSSPVDENVHLIREAKAPGSSKGRKLSYAGHWMVQPVSLTAGAVLSPGTTSSTR